MENEITEELLEKIYNRVNEFCKVKYGEEPYRILIEYNGIIARYEDYCCGETEVTDYNISVQDLTEDLDEVARKAIEEKEKQRIKEQERRQQEEILRQNKEKENRKQQYLKLKKEFEDG